MITAASGMTFGDGPSIIRAVRGHRCNLSINLIKERRHFGDVDDIVRRQLLGDNFIGDGVDPEVQLAPPLARSKSEFLIEPFSLAVDLPTAGRGARRPNSRMSLAWCLAASPSIRQRDG